MIAGIRIYKNAVKVSLQHDNITCAPSIPDFSTRATRKGLHIDHFSPGSRRRLRFLAGNIEGDFFQMALTYHNDFPTDGLRVKSDLKAFRARLSKSCPGLRYLWILEFQSRGAAHFHFFVDVTGLDNEGLRLAIASAWCARPGCSEESKSWHFHKSNWLPWSMGDGGYLTKYLSKVSQKNVPPGFTDVGRFWGKSRSLSVVSPLFIDTAWLVPDGGTKKNIDSSLLRVVRHHLTAIHRAAGCVPRWVTRRAVGLARHCFSPARQTLTLCNSAKIVWQFIEYHERGLCYG